MRPLRLFLTGFTCALASPAMPAALIDTLIERIQGSEFTFGENAGHAPLPPFAWLNLKSYADSELNLARGRIGFRELSVSQALIAPVWVGRRDMILLGESVTWQRITFQSPLTAKRNIYSAMPLAAWLRQASARTQLAAFVGPDFVRGGSYAGYRLNDATVYTGAFGTYLASAKTTWIYGGLMYFNADDTTLLPYLGLLWRPHAEWSVSVTAPWPSVSYAPTKDLMFQLGFSPAGVALAASRDGERLQVGYDSWNMVFSAHQRISKMLWLSAGAGWSGFGSFTISSGGRATLSSKLDRGAVWSLQLSVRPPRPVAK